MPKRDSRDSADWPRGSRDILGGLILPLPFLIYGIVCCVLQRGWIPSGRVDPRLALEVHGTTAIALGICAIAIAVLIHTRFIWRNWFGFWRMAGIVEAVALITFTVSMFVVIVQYVVLGRS